MTKKTLVLGSDPEFFAGYEKDGKIFVLPPAWFRVFGNVPASEDIKHPIFLNAMDELGVLIMEDGAAFEQTIRPSTDWKELFERISIGKKLLEDNILSKFSTECLPKVQSVPTINYDVDRWWQTPAEFMMCMLFGCDKDKDAWNVEYDGEEIDALNHPYRYGGAHVHVSGSEFIKNEPILAIQCLSMSAGLAHLAFTKVPELEKIRSEMYGKPGRWRLQEYGKLFEGIPNTDVGIEYRTLSNSWTSNFEHASNVFKWIEIGIRNLLEDKLGLELIPVIGRDVINAIQNADQPKARHLLEFVESRL